MKICQFYHVHNTLVQPNLSHMDFLDDPAAIQRSTISISCATKDASSNELINPKILMNNHHKRTYSFTLILPAIFPDTDISSCVCIVLLFEASSSSHVECWHCASAQIPGPWDVHLSLANVLWAWNLSNSHQVDWPWSSLIFLMWIFWMTPLQSMEAEWPYLGSQKTRGQTNTLI